MNFIDWTGENSPPARSTRCGRRSFWSSTAATQCASICAQRGRETEQTNFTLSDFLQTLSGELIGTWDAWLKSLAARTAGQKAPRAETWQPSQLRFRERLATTIHEVGQSYDIDGFSPQRVVRQLNALVREAAAFANANAYYANSAVRQDEHRTNIALELAAARTLALLSSPLMPQFAAKLWADLGHSTPIEKAGWETAPTLLCGDEPVRLSALGYFSSSVADASEVRAA